MPSAGASVPTPSGESSGGSVGLNFAIPVDLASAEANEIISTGHVTHAYFGLIAVPLFARRQPCARGCRRAPCLALDPDGPSEAAGLRVGDIITTLNGQSVVSTDDSCSHIDPEAGRQGKGRLCARRQVGDDDGDVRGAADKLICGVWFCQGVPLMGFA